MDAEALAETLAASGIKAFVEESITPFDTAYTGSFYNKEFYLKINNTDFENANKALENVIIDKNTINKDYYLFTFTNEQLFDVVCKPDEWNEFDYVLAKQLLSERGEVIDEVQIRNKRAERIRHLAAPEKSQPITILLGYIFSVFGGLIGIILGYMIWSATKTLPDGTKVYSYSPKDRANGKIIFYIGLINVPILFIIRLAMKAE
ncbi:hypothetical protein DBR32_11610 [Taibaiella sp. KBW10]|nr:hypothetical protein DBR32_11610 [Taibaiella sp. KBW10]